MSGASNGGAEREVVGTPIVLPGQRWRSLDPRDEGLVATVLSVYSDRVVIQRFRKSIVRRDRFLKHYERVA